MLNVVAIMGRLVADPELRTTPAGVNVCRFRIACDRNFAKQGEQRQADFIDIVAWRQQADFVSKYALLYTGLYFAQTHLYMGGAALKPYDVWLAAYRKSKPTPGWPFGLWQYTSTARVPGVSGNVDLSHAYKNYAKIIAKKGLTRLREGA